MSSARRLQAATPPRPLPPDCGEGVQPAATGGEAGAHLGCKPPGVHPLACSASRRAADQTPAQQQPHRAAGLGAQQAAYEALNAAQLKNVTNAHLDCIWAATVQCGLGSSVPPERSAAPADAAALTQAAQRNDLLREQGLRIPWDHVTEWEVTHFCTEERGLAADSGYLTRVLHFAAGSKFKAGGSFCDVANLRQVTAAYDAAASCHPELEVDVNRLLSTSPNYWRTPQAANRRLSTARQFLEVPASGSVGERAEAVMDGARVLKETLAGVGVTFSIYSGGKTLLFHSAEEVVQRVGAITELLHGLGLCWSDMPSVDWYTPWLNANMESLSANVAQLRTQFSTENVGAMVQRQPNIVSYGPSRQLETLMEVAAALEVSVDKAAAEVATSRGTGILRAAPVTVRETKAALVRILGQESAALDLCRRYPSILSWKADTLSAKWQSLERATAQRPEWRLEWLEWQQEPSALYQIVSRSRKSHQRLRYVCEIEAVLVKKAFTWLKMSANQFERECPGFQQWREADQMK